MAIKEPQDMDELVYFTKRKFDKGGATAWVYRGACPKCKKGLMAKPVDKKTGKTKIRSKEYVCTECGHEEQKEVFEQTLTAQIMYDCPHCGKKGEAEIPFKRKKASRFDEEKQKRIAIEVLRFPCGKCGKDIDITKKMK